MEKILTATDIINMTYVHEIFRDEQIEKWFNERNENLFKELLDPMIDLLQKKIEVEE